MHIPNPPSKSAPAYQTNLINGKDNKVEGQYNMITG